MRTTFAITLIVFCGCSASTVPPAPTAPKNPQIQSAVLKPVKVAELEQMVADNKGKVVVLDIWFLGCAQCLKKFPYFVEMHNTLAADGLVCMTVNVELGENEKKPQVLAFLRKEGASCVNLIIDDTEKNRDAWQEKNDAVGTPSYVVFNRKGERVPVSQSIKPDDMKALVKKLLDEK